MKIKKRIYAADEDFEIDDSMVDTLDGIADDVDELQDAVDEVEQDDIAISINNNITNHYIAECSACHGIFISAVVKSDQDVESISGKCPLCSKDSDQILKWIVKEV